MALDSRRMQTFFNEFLITTTSFLNQFASECEGKFFELERKLNKIESNLVIIEQKLASVPSEESSLPQNLPEIETLKPAETPKDKPKEEEIKPNVDEMQHKEIEVPLLEVNTVQAQIEVSPNENMVKICDSAMYKKYFKMLKFGIPVPAVRQKMSSEGLDANLLDKPDLLVEKSAEDDEQ